MKKHTVIAGVVILLVAAAGCSEQPAADAPAKPADSATAESETPTTTLTASEEFVAPIHGVAEVELTRPVTKRIGDEIVTTMRVRNTSTTHSIAGLRVDDYWYNTAGAPVTGNTFRHREPLQPGEIVEVTLRTPVNPRMDRNQYRFVHANGDIKTTIVPELEGSR